MPVDHTEAALSWVKTMNVDDMTGRRRTSWTDQDDEGIKLGLTAGDDMRTIARRLCRSEEAVRSRAWKKGLHLSKGQRKPIRSSD